MGSSVYLLRQQTVVIDGLIKWQLSIFADIAFGMGQKKVQKSADIIFGLCWIMNGPCT